MNEHKESLVKVTCGRIRCNCCNPYRGTNRTYPHNKRALRTHARAIRTAKIQKIIKSELQTPIEE